MLTVSLILTAFLSSSQNTSDYNDLWKVVEKYEKEGKPKSAIKETENIYQLANAEANDPQIAKAIIYQLKLKSSFEENFEIEGLKYLDSQIQNADFPVKEILFSLKAQLLWSYYQSNRYIILDRENLVVRNNDDISMWSYNDFTTTVIECYTNSLNPETKNLPIAKWAPILKEGEDSNLRPTLYDLLAFRALNHFSEPEALLNKSINEFSINDQKFLSRYTEFLNLDIESENTNAAWYYLKIIQEIMQFHMDKKNLSAFIDADLTRLRYIYNNSAFQSRDSLYYSRLMSWFMDPGMPEIVAEAGMLAANLKYNAIDPKSCNLCDAIDIAQSVINRFPDTEAAEAGKKLITAIRAQTIAVTVPEVITSNTSELALVSVKNIDQMFLRIVELGSDEYPQMQYRGNRALKKPEFYVKKPVVASWNYKYALPKDFNTHHLEVEIPKLAHGYYAILIAPDENFMPSEVLTFAEFQVSDMSLSTISDASKTEILVADLQTGMTIPGVEVELFNNDYRHGTTLISKGVTDENGKVNVNAKGNRYNTYAIAKTGTDMLVSGINLYSRGLLKENERKQTWIFTDRAVYRPGQTVQFKALLTSRIGDKVSISPNTKILFELKDLNYQVRSEITLTTNEFGTTHGSFIIPADIPTGNISIITKWGRKNIIVEEYKRPAFEISLEEPSPRTEKTEPFVLPGSIMTYSGIPVQDATIQYRITRTKYNPWRWWWRPVPDTKEIADGEISSDENGLFEITFEASPLPDIEDFYGYSYNISVIATDQSGETHETQKTVNDAIKTIIVKTELPDFLSKDNSDTIYIQVINHLEEIEKCPGNVKIEKLKLPGKSYRERLWSQSPDISLFSEDQFEAKFPLDYFEKPLPYKELQAEKTVLNSTFDNGQFFVNNDKRKKWKSGVYRITVNAVADKDTASLSREFVFIDKYESTPPENKIFEIYLQKNKFKPGDTASLLVSSSQKIHIHYLLNDGNKTLESRILSLNNSVSEIKIPILEQHQGNIYVNLFAVLNGRTYSKSITLSVPYSLNELDVEFLTFRKVIEPGSLEHWKIKVSDHKGNPVKGEMLVSMYDKSLDVFAPLDYQLSLFPNRYSIIHLQQYQNSTNSHRFYQGSSVWYDPFINRDYSTIFWSPAARYGYIGGVRTAGENVMYMSKSMEVVEDDVMISEYVEMPVEEEEVAEELFSVSDKEVKEPENLRKDFSETAFFYPDLKNNEEGVVELSFKAPQSVTGWKVLGVVHTQDLKNATFENELVTQKEIMISPNMPRFLRQGDNLVLQARINSLLKKEVSVEASLELFNPETNEPLNNLIDGFGRKIFNIKPLGSVMAEWSIDIPSELSAIGIRTRAKAENHTDGEEHIIPLLPSQTLVIESLPLSVDGKGEFRFSFDKLIEKGGTADNYALTLEYTSNPAWYAVQALPYLEENHTRSATAIFNRYYANSLASHIANYNPQIKRIFDLWKNQSPEALQSALEKNPELKTTLLQESPWLAEAKSESEQKRRIALLFDINNIARQKAETWNMLSQMQYPDGSWPWFEGMRPSIYTTLSVVENSARLYYLGVEETVPEEILKAAEFLDNHAEKEYLELKKRENFDPEKYYISHFAISWLYARSILGDNVSSAMDSDWYNFYLDQIREHWTSFGLYQQSLAAIILYFNVEPLLAENIIASLKERAMFSDKLGMYWRELHSSPYWYNAPLPTMASLIEAFTLIADDQSAVREMKKWLLTQKQTNKWNSDIATVHAVYALLLQGEEMPDTNNDIEIRTGNTTVVSADDVKEPGTGYIKKVWHGKEVKPDFGNIEVSSAKDNFSWGAMHWQYYAPYSEITSAGNGITISRKLFKKEISDQGPELVQINEDAAVKNGDKIVVRMEVTTDRDYSFVHLKDNRTAAFEPVEMNSGYRYNDGAGYYFSVRDASVNYFFDYLPKGSYVFEYELFRVRKGSYTGGLSTIQCVYAPEFNAHSSGE